MPSPCRCCCCCCCCCCCRWSLCGDNAFGLYHLLPLTHWHIHILTHIRTHTHARTTAHCVCSAFALCRCIGMHLAAVARLRQSSHSNNFCVLWVLYTHLNINNIICMFMSAGAYQPWKCINMNSARQPYRRDQSVRLDVRVYGIYVCRCRYAYVKLRTHTLKKTTRKNIIKVENVQTQRRLSDDCEGIVSRWVRRERWSRRMRNQACSQAVVGWFPVHLPAIDVK